MNRHKELYAKQFQHKENKWKDLLHKVSYVLYNKIFMLISWQCLNMLSVYMATSVVICVIITIISYG
ncbi:unnamed protein product [Schistosoma margrebowiei]|uniref:Uncharacterized protein n=1 Tax=Schistosoma margrebowiei TaxID=48269 RepID=A0A183N693_9TREM|nr:unnamed protein product [Schistosoma margrebowiei]